MIKLKNTTFTKRFWAKVRVTKNPYKCWEWTGSKTGHGYGQLNPGGRGLGSPVRAHRASWIIHNGDIPPGLSVLHSCDNPGCVRPGHLRLGTQTENMKDAYDRGRVARGEGLPQHKLTLKDVIYIRKKFYFMRGALVKDLAGRYKVSEGCIESILDQKRWVRTVHKKKEK